MAEAVHMLLRDRNAYALMSSYIHAVRTVAPDLPPEDLAIVGETVKTLASDIAKETVTLEPQPPLDVFLVEAVSNVEDFVTRRLGSNPMPAATRNVLDALKGAAAEIKCAACSRGPICSGLDADDAIVGAEFGGHCIRAIKAAITDAYRITDGEYAKHVRGVAFPSLVFRTTALEDPAGVIPVGRIAINGMTRYDDDAAAKVSEIDIRVAPTSLSRMSIAALPYLLLHEVFCHGYQMMAADGPRPNRGAVPDPISEGMVDAVGLHLLEREAARREVGASFIDQGNIEAARALHQSRYNLDLEPRFPEAPWVRQGVAAARAVEAFYAAEPPAEQASEAAVALAVAFNAAGWGFASRYSGLTKLVGGFQGSPAMQSSFGCCWNFAKNATSRPLLIT